MNKPNWYPKGTMPSPFMPREDLDTIDLAFGAADKIAELLPPVEDIPDEIENEELWEKLFGDLFYIGVKTLKIEPKEGVNIESAMRHLTCIMGSFAPKHEYKMAAWMFLASTWFKSAKWKRA